MAEVQDTSGNWVSVAWPDGSLPVPVISGSTATYPSVLPGVNLVLTASDQGMSEVLEIMSAAAASDPQLASLPFQLSGASVTAPATQGAATSTSDGLLTTAPTWWDSSQPGASPSGPGLYGSEAPLADSVSPSTISIDAAAPSQTQQVHYPLFVDPDVLDNEMNYTYVDARYPTTNYYDDTNFEPTGYVVSSDGTHVARSFWQLNLSDVMGTVVSSATFNATDEWAYSCQAEPVSLYLTGGISKSTTWDAQPVQDQL